jgi:hypothetical protein
MWISSIHSRRHGGTKVIGVELTSYRVGVKYEKGDLVLILCLLIVCGLCTRGGWKPSSLASCRRQEAIKALAGEKMLGSLFLTKGVLHCCLIPEG